MVEDAQEPPADTPNRRNPLIIVFAKAPEPGRVKTRLIPALGAGRASELHVWLVEGVWQLLESIAGIADRELHTDLDTRAWPGMEPRRLQLSGDLGERMLGALGGGLERGHRKTMILGGDVVDLPAGNLIRLLDQDADVALGPTSDGGYYAIACRRTHPAMFEGVRWSTANALSDTVRAAAACRLSVAVGDPWFDIDTPGDLEHLPDRLRRRLQLGHP